MKLLFVIKIFVFSIFERPFYTGFTVAAENVKQLLNVDFKQITSNAKIRK